ncbi:MAG TPA: hypothetical protein VMV95_01025 [Bacillota bacterium]|nr:hypothetical protein [Bacillota bacterium]
MTNQELLKKREELIGNLGQLIDLEKGFIAQIIITKENAGLLREIIAMAIENIDLELKKQQ